jgi:hypothetical protein
MICLSVKTSPFQWKWDARSIGAFTLREPTNEPQPSLVQRRQVGRRKHAGIRGDHHRRIGQIVTGLESGDDRQQRVGLGGVALKTADLQREPGPVDQQTDNDLRIDAAFLRIAGKVSVVPLMAMEPAAEIIAKYHDLWHVERSFRMSKSDLRARPMFHRTRDAIEAHLTIVFTALAVAHNIQERSGLHS